MTFVYWLTWSIRDLAAYLVISNDVLAYRFTLLVGPCAALIAILLTFPPQRRPLIFPLEARWLFLYILWCGVSLIWTQAPKFIDAACIFLSMAGDVIFVMLIMSIVSERGNALRAMCWALVVGALGIAMFVATKIDPTATTRVGDNNVGGTYLGGRIGIGALMCIYLTIRSRGTQRRLLFIILLVLACGLAATESKISLLAFSIAMLVFVFRSHNLSPAMRGSILLGCIGTGIVGLYLTAGYSKNYRDSGELQSLTGRTELWPALVSLIKAKPIIGYGLDSFEGVEPSNVEWHASHAHNEALQVWVTLGVVGVCLAFLIYRRAFLEGLDTHSHIATLLLMVLTFCIIRGLTDPEVYGLVYPLPMALMFTYCGSTKVLLVPARLPSGTALIRGR